MNVLVDTSVWSLALRRKAPQVGREVQALAAAIELGEACLIGTILQEVLQGFAEKRQAAQLAADLSAFPLVELRRSDFTFAAEVWNTCRAKGISLSTADAQIAAAAVNHDCLLLTADRDFGRVARYFPLRLA
jgi:predicted nucleic acid-binding protein